MRVHGILLAATLLLCAPGAALAQAPASVAEQYLFAAANAERTQRGLRPLRWDDALYRAADGHAREMAARSSISHRYPDEADLAERGRRAGAHFSVIAENVAESPDAVRMHEAWMHSEGHRENLLDPKVDAVGIRVLSRRGELYAVEDFARTVRPLTLDEQEHLVEAALLSVADVAVTTHSAESRQTCAMEAGYAGRRQPGFVMRYTGTDLDRLPEPLKSQLGTGHFARASVGACEVSKEENFSAYRVAVMLFP